jgi:hypothetical protein
VLRLYINLGPESTKGCWNLPEHARDITLGEFELAQDCLSVSIKHCSRVGENDALRAARKQLSIQLGLQAGMITDRGLGDMELVRSARQAASLDNSNKVAELTDVHA